jgi:hypothetical protein
MPYRYRERVKESLSADEVLVLIITGAAGIGFGMVGILANIVWAALVSFLCFYLLHERRTKFNHNVDARKLHNVNYDREHERLAELLPRAVRGIEAKNQVDTVMTQWLEGDKHSPVAIEQITKIIEDALW